MEYWKATAEYSGGVIEKRFTYAAGGDYYHEVAEKGLCERRMFLLHGGKIKNLKVVHIREENQNENV